MNDNAKNAGALLGSEGLLDLYRTVPVCNASGRQVQVEHEIVFDVPINRKRMRPAWLSWFVPLRSHRRIHLDKLGAQVLGFCDGRRTVEELIVRFSELHHLSFHESRMAVVSFLRGLMQRGAIAVVVPPGTGGRP